MLSSGCSVRGGRPGCAAVQKAARPPKRQVRPSVGPITRKLAVASASFECPYGTLGVPPTADEAEVRRAYRKAALKWHPDVSKQEGAEVRFLQLNEAYEFIMGKLGGKERGAGGVSMSDWEFHDWYWSFRISRTWGKTQAAESASSSRPQDRSMLNSQLAGLRHRAAVRATKAASGQQTSEASPPPQAATSSAEGCDATHEDGWMDACIVVGESMGMDMEEPDASWGYSQTRRKFVAHSGTRERVTGQLAGLRRKASIASSGFV
uniref:J domain-containing protein n=1 Tax=Chlamydomonas euryale TaxID=1486919 RepID=A0A7R9W1U3_9CHLO|mmetsp:Transcript_9242/g.28122  ORF Transcript_9242/g.28122 Transcript_9242/m.28122 type:complete len:264 (+) Transcript_9242:434-1225(+)